MIAAWRAQWTVFLVHEYAWCAAGAALADACHTFGFSAFIYLAHTLLFGSVFLLGAEPVLKIVAGFR